jgi:serine/threonine protein kinase/WD40 repeat protein
MNPERWKQVDQILQQALSRPPASLQSFLEEACAGDEDLRHEVESLLDHERRAGSFIDSPAPGIAGADRTQHSHPDFVGRTLLHYRIVDKIGEGGMGEVFLAQDTSLDRKVALKFLPQELQQDPAAHKRFIREAHAAAALDHPYICHINEVAQSEGRDFIVMEYVDGDTLKDTLARGLLPLKEALQIAGEIAEALEAAHGKGIIHRDIKPTNIMMTKTGHAKVMDFGLAKLMRPHMGGTETITALPDEGDTAAGVVLGTVGYMAPEQIRAQDVDQRADIFAFGCVLYEMLSGRRAFQGATAADTMSAILTGEPPALSGAREHVSPVLERIVRRCLEKRPDDRFSSARDLGFALQAVAEAVPREAARRLEEPRPYPGLAAFTEEDDEHFFGRDEEVATLWRKIPEWSLLALIGPSGAGKTSFLRAGIVPHAPPGWRCLVATPGQAPFAGLARALAPAFAGDAGAFQKLLDFHQPEVALPLVTRWRERVDRGLVIVDQFEELYTLNGDDVQGQFAELLGRIAALDGVHVLLSMRDDFFFQCSAHEALSGVFSSVTPLRPLSRAALADALIEPAKRFGFAFEDDGLVEEMVQVVEGERGVLPLLAFAVARLWEERDRERKVLTREGYERLGGVAGALAQHAEAALERIRTARASIVRELFRNLATAQQTRCVVDAAELLSVFPEDKRGDAREVLEQLVDARLLTSFEVEAPDGTRHHRVEIVHESLLQRWPRLVRWQAQDEEGMVLRDQLRQAAHLWEEKGRTDDLLWTGTAYQEFALWRGRYPGALTALEETFANAMVKTARRRKRLLTVAVVSVITVLACVALAIGISRQQATRARDVAEAEALRAEAGKLLALGRAEIDRYPTAALAYARKSLELADTPEARRFAVEVLWRGPVARILPVDTIAKQMGVPDDIVFERTALSPDGRWLATQSTDGRVLLFPCDGGPPRYLPAESDGYSFALGFGPQSDLLIAAGSRRSLRFLSVPDLREVRRIKLGGVASQGRIEGGRLVAITKMFLDDTHSLIRTWPLSLGEPKTLARLDGSGGFDIDATGTRLAYALGRTLFLRRLDVSGPSHERVLGQLRDGCFQVYFLGKGDRLISHDMSGEVRLWYSDKGIPTRLLGTSSSFGGLLAIDRDGWRVAVGGPNVSVALWDFRGPPDAEPIALKRPDQFNSLETSFDSSGQWLATNNSFAVAFWPLSSPSMRTLHGREGLCYRLAFSPDSRWLASCPVGRPTRLWPIDPADGVMRTLAPSQPCFALTFAPVGSHLLVGDSGGGAFLYQMAEGSPHPLQTGWEGAVFNGTLALAFDPQRHRAAACPADINPAIRNPKLRVLRVWDLESGEGRTYSLAHLTDASWPGFGAIRFAPDGSLYAAGKGGVFHLVLPTVPDGTVSAETLCAAGRARLDLSRDGRQLLVWASRRRVEQEFEELLVFDLSTNTSRRITTHGQRLWDAALDSTGRIVVTGDVAGILRAGPVTGEEPHLLLGHTGVVSALAVSPDGRWIASEGDDVIHLWPMPDVTKPPLQTLPHAELMMKLDALTNLRVVPDASSSTGWKLDIGPFPGWKEVPTW